MSFNVPIFISGIRDGETIVGTSKSNQGTVITIKGNYPANRNTLSQKYDNNIYTILSLLPSFDGMTKEKIYENIYINGTDSNDIYMNDLDLYVRFDNIGGTAFKSKLTEEQIEYILAGNPNHEEGFWHIKDVYNMIPANKPGSKAKRHTLIFRPSIWSITLKTVSRPEGAGLIISTFDGSVKKYHKVTNDNEIMYEINYNDAVFMGYPLYIITNKKPDFKFNLESMKQIANEILNIDNDNNGISDQWDKLHNIINWFTPSVHKSLIQKIIRTGCNYVTYNEEKYNADIVLLLSFSMLITSPGAFIPDLKKYITGFESAAKRLAVSIYEDSYTEYTQILTSMLASALLYEHAKHWKPTRDTIKSWMQIAVEAMKDKRMFEYKLIPPISLRVETYDNVTVSAMLLKEIKSFPSDLIMMNYISKYKGMHRTYITDKLIDEIPLIHCIDFHSMPHMAYLYDLNIPEGITNHGKYNFIVDKDFNKLYSRIFSHVTGVNPRKEKYKKFITDKHVINNYYLNYEQYDFTKETRKIQNRLWKIKSKQSKIDRNNTITDTHQFKYKLDKSWLAGIVGPITIKLSNGIVTLVNIHPDNIDKLVAILKPSRVNKNNELSEDDKEIAINQAWNILKEGYKLNNIPKTLFWFNNCYVRYTDYGWYIYNNDRWNTWEELRDTNINLPIVSDMYLTIDNAIDYKANAIVKDADSKLKSILSKYDINIIKRLLTHTVGYKYHIELFKLNKKGYGSEYIVYKIDNDVYHILSYICILYPAALQLLDAYRFVVKYGPLFWHIRDIIQEYTVQKLNSKYNKWSSVNDVYNRQLWEHQKDSIYKMIKRHKQGKKGHLLWIPVRFGKTLIVLNYLKFLIDNNKMPPYCVYTLPRSAITAIINELEMFGFKYNLLDSKKNSTNKIVQPYAINLIEHDHMRLNDMDIQLKTIAPNMIFINDEFHKTLNKTKRTSLALELARLSVDFIGLSGTIIQNENIEDIIKWLEQIVEFEVTETNFYVAISAMISKKIQTKVTVLRHDMEVQMTDKEMDIYKDLSLRSKLKKDMKVFRQLANLCWNVCNRYIIESVLHYIGCGERVMVVAKDIDAANYIKETLIEKGLDQSHIFTIDKDNTINLTYNDTRNYYCVITTSKYNSGYSLSKLGVMITSVYFDNQATREQLEGRINEPNQLRQSITILTLHCGILTYTLKNHENVRSLSQALKGYADEIIHEQNH